MTEPEMSRAPPIFFTNDRQLRNSLTDIVYTLLPLGGFQAQGQMMR